MNIQKQSDCSLYAMAVATFLAFKGDPTTVVFDQHQLRTHYGMKMETEKQELVPTTKKRQPKDKLVAR